MPESWLETYVDVPQDVAEAMANRLVELGSPGLVVEENGAHTRLTAYFEREDQVDAARRFAALLAEGVHVHTKTIDSQDWAENWKEHFPPLLIGNRLYVCPPWAPPPPPGRIAIVIDPGMAFGTGNHITTRACLELLERYVQPGDTVIDVGTGSGVLSIAALKLGARRALGVDTDPLATAAALANAARNQVAPRLEAGASLDDVQGGFDLALANIQLNVLVELEPRIAACVRPGGLLVASGLLREELDAWRTAYVPHWDVGETTGDERWVAAVARRR